MKTNFGEVDIADLNKNDDRAIFVDISIKEDLLVVDYGRKIRWTAMDKEMAEVFINKLQTEFKKLK